jgi:hypothetical protein
MNIFDNFFPQLGRGDTIKDYQHASRLFVDNNYALSPKYSWLFHVFFDLNPTLARIDRDKNLEAGMLVKGVDLPKFTINTKTLNNYNRPNIVQNKVNYDSINITFHDDQSNVIRKLWFDYYNYYYRDTDAGYDNNSGGINPVYQAPNKYTLGQRDRLNNFGYSPRTSSLTTQYIQSIRIYSLHQKKFSEYTLINPTITAFSHGNHDVSTQGGLESSMTISYETVLYSSGRVSVNTVKGFADLHYDKAPSPLTVAGGGTNSILGPGGILAAADEITQDGRAGNFGSAAFKLLRATQNNKNVDLKGLAAQELLTAGKDIINGKDPRDRFYVPYSGSLADKPSAPGGISNFTSGASAGSVSSNGSGIGLGKILATAGTVLAVTGKPALGAGLALAGVAVNSQGSVTGGSLNKVVNITYNSPLVAVSSTSPEDDFTYNKALNDIVATRSAAASAERVKNEQITKATASQSAPNSQNILSSQSFAGSQSIATVSQAPLFTTGTNATVQNTNPLLQTPWSSTYIPPETALANRDAANFTTGTNVQTLVEGTPGKYTGGRSTVPARS